MKKKIKKMWFCILCFMFSLGIVVYSFVMPFIDEEIFFITTQLSSVFTLVIILMLIGIIDFYLSNKEEK